MIYCKASITPALQIKKKEFKSTNSNKNYYILKFTRRMLMEDEVNHAWASLRLLEHKLKLKFLLYFGIHSRVDFSVGLKLQYVWIKNLTFEMNILSGKPNFIWTKYVGHYIELIDTFD